MGNDVRMESISGVDIERDLLPPKKYVINAMTVYLRSLL